MERRLLLSGFLVTSTVDLTPGGSQGGSQGGFASAPVFLAAADLNDDGKSDLVAVQKNGTIGVYLGGALSTPRQVIAAEPGITATSLLVADVTGDGIPDIVLGYTYHKQHGSPVSNVVIFTGNGDGTFSRGEVFNGNDSAGFPGGAPEFLATAEFNGHVDLIVSDFASDTILYGDGAGHLAANAGAQLGGSPGILAEGNFNGRPGLVVAGPASEQISLISSNADGTFTPSRVIASAVLNRGVNGYGVSGVSVADFNGDGKPDLLIAGYDMSPRNLTVLLGNGDGTFKAPISAIPNAGYSSSFAVAEATGDGRPDVIAFDSNQGTLVIIPGNGDGTFGPAEIASFTDPEKYYLTAVAVGDFNGDGHPDLVGASQNNGHDKQASSAVVSVAYGGPAGAGGYEDFSGGSSASQGFGAGKFLPPGFFPTVLAAGDLNGDGNTDVVTTNVYRESVDILLGDGKGGFRTSQVLATGNGPAAVAIADVNHDGIPDLVVSNALESTVDVFLGNGDGTFRLSQVIAQRGGHFSVVVGDFNHDGNPDILVDAYGLQLLPGNGDGTFGPAVVVSSVEPTSMTLADFNGDGNLDVLCIEGGGLIVLLGNGDGTFRTESLVPEASWMNYRMRVQSAVVGDFNGDGIPDIIYKTSNQIVELPGNGNGTFGRPRVVINLPGAYASSGGEFFGNLAIADINGDGKPDLIYEDRLAPGAIPSKGMPYGTVALLGNGDGTFSPPSSANLNNPAYGPVISAIDLGSGGGEAVLAAQLNGTFREIVNTFSPRPRSPSLNVPADLTFASGGAGSFLVSAGGYPTPSIAASGDLPPGLTFVDDGNGMGRLSGTPAPGDSGVYHFSLTASNGIDPAAEGSYLIDIVQAPVISSAGSATFPAGFASSFTIRAGGFPAPVLSEAGALPTGVSFTDLGDGTAALSVGPDAATGQYALVFSADSSAGTASQTFTLTISEAPSISTSSTAAFTSGTAGSLLISTAGFPNPTLNLSGALPAGVTFTDHQDGTATISGTPAAGAAGVFHLTLTASNGVGPGASQNVTLSVAAAPAITSSVGAAFAPGTAGSFIITTTGAPAAALTETGPLPAGMSFHDNGDGTATISGAPIYGAQGLYPLTLRAANMTGAATQTFNLNVGASGAAAPIIALLGYTLNGLGTTTNDIASINLAGGNLIVTIDSLTKSFPAGAVHSIYMTMNAGDDSLTIGAGIGAVFASGGEGNDTIVAYNSANDTLDGDAGNDSIAGGAGMDFLRGGAGNDTLVAGSGLNTLNGNTGDDSLVGGAGHALLNGGAGSNIILVGQNDTLVGGGGMDSILRGL